jgi:hypothetical protein
MVEAKVEVSEGAAVWKSNFASAVFGGRGSSMTNLRDFYVIVDFLHTGRLRTSFIV